MKEKELASAILDAIGGSDNVSAVNHCATRLRFNVKNPELIDEETIKNTNGVIGYIVSGGQYQVVIGPNVAVVYNEVDHLLDGKTQQTQTTEESPEDTENKSLLDRVLDTITGIFSPVLPAITGAAMIKVLLILLTMVGWLSTESQTYQILSFVGDTPFYFLPVLLAYNAAKKFGMNPMMGLTIALFMVHPTYNEMVAAGDPVNFMGLPVTLARYSSTVIPTILVIWAASYVEKFGERVLPNSIKFFTKPLLTLLVAVPLAFVILGPLGTIVGSALESVLSTVQTNIPWVLPFIFGALAPVFIMFGMHYAVTIPLTLTAIQANGFDMIGPGFLVANMAQAGAALAVARLAKDTNFKALANSSGITALFGITEPAMYGVNLKLKKPFMYALIAGGIGGLIAGIAGVKRIEFGPTGLTTLPIFIDPNNSSNFIFAIISALVSFVLAYAITYFMMKKDDELLAKI
ncbi:PTS transporter subunit EIIC [Fundicoccus culcitae]|uniref:PTS transporter subunit EIIC n=1 Tax=Fundicoccus culcitae TaxID=2969821 RepID=A0ABY5P4S7_9LACT|nr:PTS transporter subunit EIIC [Fundicoccus culcitae]UUX33554.1 PTS transporter subunit EIIC [Fundicoccus culcitae]